MNGSISIDPVAATSFFFSFFPFLFYLLLSISYPEDELLHEYLIKSLDYDQGYVSCVCV